MRAVGAVVGALAAVSVGFAPSAAAYDAQSKQWYLDGMQAEQMWKVSTGKGVKVAVIDTGVNAKTASLKGQVLADEVPQRFGYHATQDYTGHGTTIAELIAGTGVGGGLKGLAPGAKIVPYRVKLEGLKGESELRRTPEPAEAIRAAADSDAKIINMSFGSDTIDPDEEAALKYAASKGKLILAGVGNEGREAGHINYPAAYPYAVGVSAVDSTGTVGKFASYGNYVDLSAPGQDIPAWCDSTFRSYCDARQGTSQATAIASGSAALIWSAHPDWTANQVLGSLIDTASRTWKKNDPSRYLGYGTVRPRKVLENPDYNPGPARQDPLAKENGGSAKTETAPSASASGSSQPERKASEAPAEAAGSEAKSSSDGNTLWIALGVVAAVIVIGGGGFVVMRARRSQ
ncbi:S8 family serine peptidase [Streptomyces sp. NPDC052225]|uniref:S8 family serine peptidase n=1 Tax=Streptomyces sp. NPDC052225 TaxID=3154949 RepID=UPI00341FEC48